MTYVLSISDVCISRLIILYTIVDSHRVYMYMWCAHCVLLDERIFSEEEEAKLQAVFGLDIVVCS